MSEITEAMLAAGETALFSNVHPFAPETFPTRAGLRQIYLAMSATGSLGQSMYNAMEAIPLGGFALRDVHSSHNNLIWTVFQAMVEARDEPRPPQPAVSFPFGLVAPIRDVLPHGGRLLLVSAAFVVGLVIGVLGSPLIFYRS